MRRAPILAALVICMATMLAAPANAAKPINSGVFEGVVDLHFPANTVCAFPLDVHQELKVKTITFVDADGEPTRAISTGKIHAWETNASTGETRFLSISGPSFFDAAGTLVWGTGGWSGIQLQDGTWINARGLISFDENGLVSWVRGHVEPLCDSLA